jgi:hypothetical protein
VSVCVCDASMSMYVCERVNVCMQVCECVASVCVSSVYACVGLCVCVLVCLWVFPPVCRHKQTYSWYHAPASFQDQMLGHN